MKYFFLADGWTYGRVWEFGGLWDQTNWRRQPEIQQLNFGVVHQGETLWLYAVEDAVLMLEVQPLPTQEAESSIGQVILKRLITAEQVIEMLTRSQLVFNRQTKQS